MAAPSCCATGIDSTTASCGWFRHAGPRSGGRIWGWVRAGRRPRPPAVRSRRGHRLLLGGRRHTASDLEVSGSLQQAHAICQAVFLSFMRIPFLCRNCFDSVYSSVGMVLLLALVAVVAALCNSPIRMQLAIFLQQIGRLSRKRRTGFQLPVTYHDQGSNRLRSAQPCCWFFCSSNPAGTWRHHDQPEPHPRQFPEHHRVLQAAPRSHPTPHPVGASGRSAAIVFQSTADRRDTRISARCRSKGESPFGGDVAGLEHGVAGASVVSLGA